MKKRTTNSSIFRLKNNIDQWVDSHEGIRDLLLSSFKDRFTSANRPMDLSFIKPIVTDSDSSFLSAPFSNDDIKAAFFDMGLGLNIFQAANCRQRNVYGYSRVFPSQTTPYFFESYFNCSYPEKPYSTNT